MGHTFDIKLEFLTRSHKMEIVILRELVTTSRLTSLKRR